MDENVQLALPAAERSLHYARLVSGQDSLEVVQPLLAMADVATAAGAEENGLTSVTQAQVIATRFVDKQREMVKRLLEKRISRDF